MGFGFGEVDDEKAEGRVYLEPGIHLVAIDKVSYEVPEVKEGEKEKAPFIQVDFKNPMGVHSEKFYMSPAAVPTSMSRMSHLFTKVIKKEELVKADDKANGDGKKLADAINKLVVGKRLKIKVISELSNNGKSYNKFGYPPFAEEEGVAKDKTKLRFDPERDIQKPAQGNATGAAAAGAPSSTQSMEW